MNTAKDMWKVYSRTSTIDLIKNKHKKEVALYKLQNYDGYWAKKERARLHSMIFQITAVIEARKLQEPLI